MAKSSPGTDYPFLLFLPLFPGHSLRSQLSSVAAAAGQHKHSERRHTSKAFALQGQGSAAKADMTGRRAAQGPVHASISAPKRLKLLNRIWSLTSSPPQCD